MPEISRTLVKSAPELWAEVSDAAALGRRLEAFGSVAITRTVPEELVQWEGELASGTIRLEPSGFGTKVTLAAELVMVEPPPPPPAPPPPEPAKPGFWARLMRRTPPLVEPPEPPAPPAPEPRMPAADAQEALTATLDALGFANHRPFSRA